MKCQVVPVNAIKAQVFIHSLNSVLDHHFTSGKMSPEQEAG